MRGPAATTSAALIAVILTACASGAPSSPAGTASSLQPPSTATARPTVSTTPSAAAATARPAVDWSAVTVDLAPAFRIPMPADGDINRLAVVGDEVWAPAGSSIVRVDVRTRKTTSIDSPVSAEAADAIGATNDAVWVGDFDRGRVYRLDPSSGAVLSEVTVPAPVTFASAHGLIWIGSGQTRTMYTIDPAGSEATRTNYPHELVAGDSAWGAGRRVVVRMAIDTGEKTSITVDEPLGPGDCSVRGSSASLWMHCHGNDVVARIDPDTNSVAATVEVGGPVFGGVLSLERWAFFIEGRDETGSRGGRIVRVDLATNEVDRVFDLGPEFDPNPPVVAADALWVPIAGRRELWVLPLEDLLAD